MSIVPYVLEVGSQEVILTPDARHEFTATTEQVALGYGVTPENIRKHKETKAEELLEGKHWVVSITHTPGGQQKVTLWTKRGIVRLGFFIRSARARLFRDVVEDLFIGQMTANVAAPQPSSNYITAADIGLSVGKSRNAVLNDLSRRAHIPAVASGISGGTKTACYLFPLDKVADYYSEYELVLPFQPYTGRVVKSPRAALSRAQRGVRTRTGHTQLPSDMDVDTLARVIAVAVKAALA